MVVKGTNLDKTCADVENFNLIQRSLSGNIHESGHTNIIMETEICNCISLKFFYFATRVLS